MADIKQTPVHDPSGVDTRTYWNNNEAPALNAKNLNEIEDAINRTLQISTKVDQLQAALAGLEDISSEQLEQLADYIYNQTGQTLTQNGKIDLSQLAEFLSQLYVGYTGTTLTEIGIGDNNNDNDPIIFKSYLEANYGAACYNETPTVTVTSNVAKFSFSNGVNSDKFLVHIDTSALTDWSINYLSIKLTNNASSPVSKEVKFVDSSVTPGVLDVVAFNYDSPYSIDVVFEKVLNGNSWIATLTHSEQYGNNTKQIKAIIENLVDAYSVDVKLNKDVWSGGSISTTDQPVNLNGLVTAVACVPGAVQSTTTYPDFENSLF